VNSFKKNPLYILKRERGWERERGRESARERVYLPHVLDKCPQPFVDCITGHNIPVYTGWDTEYFVQFFWPGGTPLCRFRFLWLSANGWQRNLMTVFPCSRLLVLKSPLSVAGYHSSTVVQKLIAQSWSHWYMVIVHSLRAYHVTCRLPACICRIHLSLTELRSTRARSRLSLKEESQQGMRMILPATKPLTVVAD